MFLCTIAERRVKLKCDICGKETETSIDNYRQAQKKRNHSGITYCRACTCKMTANKPGPRTTKGKTRPHLQKENSPNWKGGRYIDAHGYVMVHVGKNLEVKSKWESYQKEHVVVMEEQLGRKLTKDECVHHIDGNRQNNKLENLVVIPSNKHHKITHYSLQKIGYELVKTGLIQFDREACEYKAYEKLRELLGYPTGQSAAEPEMEGSTTRRKPKSTEQ